MRQFVFGVLVAAFAWWGYGKWSQSEVMAKPAEDRVTASQLARGSMSELLGGAMPAAVESNLAAQPSPAPVPVETIPSDLEELIALVKRGDASAISTAWLAVASGRLGPHHDGLVALLRPRGESFEGHLAALGKNNAFLRSAEGRAAARKATAAAMAMPDAEAVDAGTELIYRMTCGRIARADLEWRKVVEEARVQHRIRVDRWLCNPTNVAGARIYTVKNGDSLDRIARRFRREGLKVESGTIAVLNRIRNANALKVGQRLKVPVAPITAILEKDSFALMVFCGDQLLRLYWVGHGANDHTPVTEFEVIAKQERPDWTSPDGNLYAYGDPKNVLGEYFIKFGHAQYSGFGAHGTPDEDTICTESSMGCIRMFAPDIKELFHVLPRGATVVVRDTASS